MKLFTYTGKEIDLHNLDLEAIDIIDIAHSLSLCCRFNGHIDKFYSVAEHSVNVSLLVADQYKTQALLHDASEAYTGDLITPICKYHDSIQELKDSVEQAIAKKFNLEWPDPGPVKDADYQMYQTEVRDLVTNKQLWDDYDEALTSRTLTVSEPLNSVQARISFLQHYVDYNTNIELKELHRITSHLYRSVYSLDSAGMRTVIAGNRKK